MCRSINSFHYVVRNRSVTEILLSLESIFMKHGMPKALFCDQESSILSLARSQGWPLSGSGFLFHNTSELTCLFSPARNSGHERNGLCERMILGIKKVLGDTDFASTNIDWLAFGQILNSLASRLNNLPIATKRTKTPGPGLENLLTPEILFKG